MNKYFILIVIFCFLALVPLAAQAALGSTGGSAPVEAAMPDNGNASVGQPPPKDKEYLELVEAALTDPVKADWCKIRERYPGTSFYRALGDPLARGKVAEIVGKKLILDRTPDSVDVFKKFLHDHFGNLDSHRYAAYLYRWNNDLTSQKMQGILPAVNGRVNYIDFKLARRGAREIMKCFVASGDGKGFETAYHAIHADEMFILVEQYFHVDATDWQIMHKNGKYYSVIGIQIPESTQQLNIHFHLDDRMMQASKNARETSGKK